jgi:hypothetical protein
MQLTDAMLQAAVRKAVEVELLPKAGFIDVRKEGWRPGRGGGVCRGPRPPLGPAGVGGRPDHRIGERRPP